MSKNIADEIAEDLIMRLPEVAPDVIYIFGGDNKIRRDVIGRIASRVEGVVTDDSSVENKYPVNLEYFIKRYKNF